MAKFMMLISFLVRQNVFVKVDYFFSTVELMSKVADLLSNMFVLLCKIITVETHAYVSKSSRYDSKYADQKLSLWSNHVFFPSEFLSI